MFGRRLRLARKRAGLSLRALAGRMEPKVTAQAISKYETGKMMPSSAVLVGLAQSPRRLAGLPHELPGRGPRRP